MLSNEVHICSLPDAMELIVNTWQPAVNVLMKLSVAHKAVADKRFYNKRKELLANNGSVPIYTRHVLLLCVFTHFLAVKLLD